MRSDVDAPQLDSWAAALTDRFIRCRDMGHRWRSLSARWDDHERLYHRLLRCTECSTRREQELDYLGIVVHSHYEYPEGYQAPAGTGRLSTDDRGALRLESLRRVLDT